MPLFVQTPTSYIGVAENDREAFFYQRTAKSDATDTRRFVRRDAFIMSVVFMAYVVYTSAIQQICITPVVEQACC